MNKPNPIIKTIDLGDGKPISIETGKLAKQADGSVVVRQGNTMLLATVVSAKDSNPDVDFMPLSVDYKENFSAMGKFPGGFRKREARPGDHEILVSRLVDRALRPLFPADYHAETFVNVQLISGEDEVLPDALAGLAASAALAVSTIPFNGPISEVRVARVEGEFIINPTLTELKKADIDLMLAATIDNILMVEGEMDEVSEAEMLEAMKLGHDAVKAHCQAQIELAEEVGSTVKRDYTPEPADLDLENLMKEKIYDKLYEVAKAGKSKNERSEAFEAIETEFIESENIDTEDKDKMALIHKYHHDIMKDAVRNCILDEKVRLDGRKTDQIRPIWTEIDYLPSVHGSAIFTRGETQSLTTVTLGSKYDEQIIDTVMEDRRDKFMLHYNFPPYATGDARAYRGTGRREIGHGNLAFRALKGIIPEKNAYTIRVVSDILESNGSSSMATVCAGTLALMDCGVKIKKPVSGIAMGLITDTTTDRWAVLSDILGDEDHLGDMDFKVTGTKDGITACQMDIKVDGLSYEILEKALAQAREGRLHILGEMMKTIEEPREELKEHAPRIEVMLIEKDMIGAVIGGGGKVIQELQALSGAIISIDEENNMGVVTITAPNAAKVSDAKARIHAIVDIPEEGTIYEGKVVSIVEFGAFVEVMPGKEGLLHISEIDIKRVEKVEDELSVGDVVKVKLIKYDRMSGKMKLSKRALMPGGERPPRKEDGGKRRDNRKPRRRD